MVVKECCYYLGQSLIAEAIKLFLAAGTPLQKLFSGCGITHLFCVRQALNILTADGRKKQADILRSYLRNIEEGVLWADWAWKNFFHYYDPRSKRGLGPLPSAKVECSSYLEKASRYWKVNNPKKAFFFLGASAHIIQDLCVPHHARNVALCHHMEYEKWVEKNYQQFIVESDGVYLDLVDPTDYVEYNANLSWGYLPFVIEKSVSSFKIATSFLLPLAQRSTAGFFSLFLSNFCQ